MLRKSILSALVLALAATGAHAQSKGDYTIGVGIANVNPKGGNGTTAAGDLDIDDDTQISLTFEYFIADNLGIELLAATPFKHDFTTTGGAAGEVTHLPPTVSLNYHIPMKGGFTPFVGLGVNYTTALDVDSNTPGLDLEDSWGLSATLGVDFSIADNAALRTEVRWMDIDMDVTVNGTEIGTAEVDPVVLGVSYVRRF